MYTPERLYKNSETNKTYEENLKDSLQTVTSLFIKLLKAKDYN